MSKKSKKSQQQKTLIEELPSKSQCKMLSETLDKNHMDHTQYLLFIAEDFENLSSRSQDDEQTPILERIACDFKHLLQSSAIVFWSTCSYNSYLQKSLDSFLKYAKKQRFSQYIQENSGDFLRKQPSHELFLRKNHGFLEWMQEIYRLVFLIYSRMSSKKELVLKEIDVSCIIFENWLFDTVKALDLIAIFGCEDANREILCIMIRSFFELNKEYYDDFYNTVTQIKKNCEKNLCLLVEFKKREKLLGAESKLFAEDVENRYANLLSLLDFSYVCNDFLAFFPQKCKETLVLDEKIALLCENLYYEAENCREFLKESLKEGFEPLISQILRNIAGYFVKVFAFFSESLENKLINETNSKKFCAFLQKMLANFGKMMFASKKEPVNLSLLRHLLRLGFDLAAFLAKMPVFMDLFATSSAEQISILAATFESLKEELKVEDCEKAAESSEEESENIEKAAEITQGDAQLQHKTAEKEELCEKIDEKIRYTEVIIGKKQREIEKMDEIAKEQAADFIKRQMLEYEDEYDDTLEIYNDTRLVVEKNQLDPDSEEEAANFNQENEYNDEKNDEFEGKGHEDSHNKSNTSSYNRKKYKENEERYRGNSNNYSSYQNNYYSNKGGYTKYYEKKNEETQENTNESVVEDHKTNKNYYDPKRKYNQEKSYKNKATYKRKY